MHLPLSKRSICGRQTKKRRIVPSTHISEHHNPVSAREDLDMVEVKIGECGTKPLGGLLEFLRAPLIAAAIVNRLPVEVILSDIAVRVTDIPGLNCFEHTFDGLKAIRHGAPSTRVSSMQSRMSCIVRTSRLA